MRRRAWIGALLDRGGLLAISILVLYVLVAPDTIVYGDNAELSSLSRLGGAAHPSGYPLYVLWLRAWSWLPASSPAHAAAIATCLLTALHVLVLHAAARAWGASVFGATIATGLFATGPIVLRIQSEAEVFALNGLLCAAILWLSAHNGPLKGATRTFVLGVVAGLAMSNHLTCVLVAPVGVLGAIRGVRESTRPKWVVVALPFAGLALGLLPYAYLLVAPDTWSSWGKIDSVAGVVRHFLREDYGGAGQFSPVNAPPEPAANMLAFMSSTGRAYLWGPSVLAVVGLVWLSFSRDGGETRWAWRLLLVSWLLAGPLLVLRFNLEPAGTGLYVVQRFHLLSLSLLVLPLAMMLGRLVKRVNVESWRRLSSPLASGALTVVGVAITAAPSLPYVARMHSPAIEIGLQNMLESLPPNAIVFGAPDAFHFGFGYLQGALGKRRDVVAITTPQLGLVYARERIRVRTGIVIEPVARGSDEKLTVQIAERAVATGRPVFIDAYQANIAAAFPTYPYGLLFRVLPKGTIPPSIDEVFRQNKELFARYRFGYAFPHDGDELAAQFHRFYARCWRMIAQGLLVANRSEDYAFATSMADALEPRP